MFWETFWGRETLLSSRWNTWKAWFNRKKCSKAEDPSSEFAMKIIDKWKLQVFFHSEDAKTNSKDMMELELLESEISTLRRLDHPNCIHLFDVFLSLTVESSRKRFMKRFHSSILCWSLSRCDSLLASIDSRRAVTCSRTLSPRAASPKRTRGISFAKSFWPLT